MTAPGAEVIERRPFLKVTAGALAAVTGCRRNLDRDRAYARGNTLIVGADIYDKGALNPDELPATLMFLPLVRLDDRGDRQPCLAERWEHSTDYLEWTYYLRPGVRWHDGTPVTAADVKCGVDVWRVGYGSPMECVVHNASTVTVRGSVWTRMGWDTAPMVLPSHLVNGLTPARYYQWDFWLRPVGNGAYRFVRRQEKTMVKLEANRDFYKGKPNIERIVLKFVQAAGLNELLSGNVDAIEVPDPAQLYAITGDFRLRTYWRPSAGLLGVLTLAWQNDHPLFRESGLAEPSGWPSIGVSWRRSSTSRVRARWSTVCTASASCDGGRRPSHDSIR
jgi:ABC-type transport system substrate-binding protein